MNVIGLVLVLAVVCLYEIPSLVRQKLWRELAAFLCVSGLAFTLALLMMIGVDTPNPLTWLEAAAKWIVSLFG
jgi:hypothetical protein